MRLWQWPWLWQLELRHVVLLHVGTTVTIRIASGYDSNDGFYSMSNENAWLSDKNCTCTRTIE